MKPVSLIRLFGAVNMILVPLFLVISWAAARSLEKEFLSARFPVAVISFCVFAFTLWLIIACALMLTGRRFARAALFWNGILLLSGFGALTVLGLLEKTAHDAGFFCVIAIMTVLIVFGVCHLFVTFRPAVREWAKPANPVLSLFHPAVFLPVIVLCLAGPSAAVYFHWHGIERPCFVSKISASASAQGHEPSLVFDSSPESFWSPSLSADGVGAELRIDFPFSDTIEAVAVGAGGTLREAGTYGRIKTGVFHFSTGDEIAFNLENDASLQRIDLGVINVRWMTMTVLSVYPGKEKALSVGAVIPLRRTPVFR
jgi:hypothetical protein